MADKTPDSKKGFSADWFLRGALTKIGDTVDRFTGRRWIPSSSLATSELAERLKKLLDAEAKDVPGKGLVVPHNIKLKMQWDKFSTDADDALKKLENELLAAAADHINDSLYYTYAPLRVEVKPDYFTEGVKLYVSFDKFSDDETDAQVNVTVPAVNLPKGILEAAAPAPTIASETFIARFELQGSRRDKRLEFPAGRRLSVGRTGSNDLAIDDISVSKVHASLISDSQGQLSVADTGSTNGTFINGERIAYGKATRLVEGDKVKFGVVEVVFDHIPRPIQAEPDATEIVAEESVEIGGFEFKRGGSPEPAADSTPDLPVPDDTLKLGESQPGESKDDTIATDRASEKQDDKTGAEVSE